MQPATKQTDIVALLAAVAIFLSSIEYAIPRPLPFLRLGIANLPILISLRFLKIKYIFLLIGLKVLAQGFIFGTLFSHVFIFSFCGGFSSGIVMIILINLLKKNVSLIGVSIMGAFASNSIQLLLAGLIAYGSGALFIAPPFLLVGTISATLLGAFTETFIKKSRWVKEVLACIRKSN